MSGLSPAFLFLRSLQRRFAGLWRQLAERFRAVPHDRLVFELLNEPTAADNAQWNDVAALVPASIRNVTHLKSAHA